ncbi:hypothetical protein A3C23_04755 [Candidatus Roizmanbacteria bacterium RIFCSPHIGHO2_02_FULL_37_13b]|uniref:Cohesin domain-containing protein n=1 Tax=Candidatus Roizmanbacteria bacterium RIFCSPLOWO2_02_FULL_36_11 TaxID=1802071 RepID=A0A1F7JHR9_9BACT|nr:MAG: hypothetical protein A3C23_04755 [Candidatus Roizmanbacteria bacterium RIFCSPHIGHO2_02_FULL_37_13b]OGK55163.1 MAG: hypothetical protein A3H78_05880 [Candidatus Roizmanbacteria bacterium RIFCSPLOWO2_02_FULL_36_11]
MNNLVSKIQTSLKKDLVELQKLDSNRRFLLIALLITIFIISFLVGGYFFKKTNTTPFTPEETSQPAPTTKKIYNTTLNISPATDTLTVGEKKTASVNISEMPVTAVDIGLTYDPAVITLSNPQLGSAFDTVIKDKRTTEPGVLFFHAAVKPDNKDNLREGAVFTFDIVAKKEVTKTLISFDPLETYTGLNGKNTVGTTLGANYKIVK